jgi:hypothetical protein
MEQSMTTPMIARFKTRQAERNALLSARRRAPRPMPTDYAPYHTLPAFDEGIDDYMSGQFENPYADPRDGVKAQAWDRGSKYCMRVIRWTDQQYLPDFAQ